MISLSPEQCRVIGVMLEKETTTPDQYPLSLNAITTGCNQKSNREPVMALAETEVQTIVDELEQSNQLMVDHKASGRVNKYFHRFCNTEFGSLQFSPQQRAIICVLLLRGPQTPGELRTRTNRLADFTDVSEVESALEALQDLNGQTLVKKLAREPGKRESRYVQLFSELSEASGVLSTASNNSESHNLESHNPESHFINDTNHSSIDDKAALAERVVNLEKQVAALLTKMDGIADKLNNSE
jgi:hypothetical protein